MVRVSRLGCYERMIYLLRLLGGFRRQGLRRSSLGDVVDEIYLMVVITVL